MVIVELVVAVAVVAAVAIDQLVIRRRPRRPDAPRTITVDLERR